MIKATFKSLLSRKLRLTLSGIAVVLGVTFVSGAFVLTDTVGRSFEGLFTTIYENTEIDVTKQSELTGLTGQPVPVPLSSSAVDTVSSVPGVRSAKGTIFTSQASIVGENRKTVVSPGAPMFGGAWNGEDQMVHLRSGRAPAADDEVVLSANIAASGEKTVGESVKVKTTEIPDGKTYTIVGILEYSGGRDSLAGETSVLFTQAEAQRAMFGKPDTFSNIDVKVADGADRNAVRDRIAAALGSGYQVKTGEQLAAESSNSIKEGLKYINYILLGFAAVALFVGMFLIINTFSIIVAQRTRELALFRAMGASRRQVINSVLIEAGVIGVLSATVGLLLGIGVGALLGAVVGNLLSGGSLELAALGVPASAVISAYLVGVGITMVAALLPAIRASRIPPVAAMRESATPDRPLTAQTVSGAAVLAAGVAVLWLGLIGKLGGANLGGVLGGLLVSFVGVALLTPAISKPVVNSVGRVFDWSAAGKLGRSNSTRNPRRTAITAAALMVSIALVTGISVVFQSIKVSLTEAVTETIHSDMIIAGGTFGAASFDPDSLTRIRAVPGVESAVGISFDLGKVNGMDYPVQAADQLPVALTAFTMTPVAGTLSPLESGKLILDDQSAKTWGVSVGGQVTVKLAKADERPYTVQGIYKASSVNSGPYIPYDDALAGFTDAQPRQGYVQVRSGSSVDGAYTQIETILSDNADVSVSKMGDYVKQQEQTFDAILYFIQMLLGLAMIIAVLGIINTLALSITERTREFGLLRAVGTQRRQVMWMVTVESVVISVFGALLGVAVGAGLGAVVFLALKDLGFTTLAFPWPLMVGYVVASVFVGLAAALIPAIRSARLDVLRAIAYE